MLESSKNPPKTHKDAAWTGYSTTYVQNIIHAGLKVLKLLGTLTFDVTLLMWVKGLENHLLSRMKEAEKAKKELQRYKFK